MFFSTHVYDNPPQVYKPISRILSFRISLLNIRDTIDPSTSHHTISPYLHNSVRPAEITTPYHKKNLHHTQTPSKQQQCPSPLSAADPHRPSSLQHPILTRRRTQTAKPHNNIIPTIPPQVPIPPSSQLPILRTRAKTKTTTQTKLTTQEPSSRSRTQDLSNLPRRQSVPVLQVPKSKSM
ncbi:hypothetical protein M501DRAFT_1003315, partial [Patellaria atrata CBS 101060]